VSISVGDGFDSVSDPSAFFRMYQGANTELAGSEFVEMVFQGKLKGRSSSEIYMGRLLPQGQAPGSFSYLPAQNSERLVADTNGATYRSRGLKWNMGAISSLFLRAADGTMTQLFGYDPASNPSIYPSNASFDAQSGLVTFNSALGGRITIDPNQGTVRLSTGQIPKGADLLATYQPALLRMSVDLGSGFVGPSQVFDMHYVTPDVTNPAPNRVIPGWYLKNNSPAVAGSNRINQGLEFDRYVTFYNRAAMGAGRAARPLMNTMRFGVRLPFSLEDTDGNAYAVSVTSPTGLKGAYEVDPAQNRVYFSRFDEDRQVTITANGNSFTANVGFVQELGQEEVLIEQAVNESGLTAFVDPFIPDSGNALRPPLIWLFWTSTRSGNPDVYFQTIAPHIAPVLKGQ